MSTTEPFNADTRARARESQKITIGGREFHPTRRTPKVMRQFRSIVRKDTELARGLDDLDESDFEGREAIEDSREDLMYEMVAAFVKPKEEGESVDLEFLSGHLDIEDVSDLLDSLTPGAAPDPTPADTPPPTST